MDAASSDQRGFSYVAGGVGFVVITAIVTVLWYVLMHPDGILKLYTPMYGFALVAVFLCCVVLVTRVLGFYPLSEGPSQDQARLQRGIGLTVFTFILMLFVFYAVFRGFIGKFGVAYFSPDAIVASGGTGAEPYNARENSSTAIIYFATAFLWWALAWQVGFGRWPWVTATRGVVAWSRLTTVLVLTIVTFAVLFHPHVCSLFYPPQNKAGVEAWWSSFAGTSSAYFSLGLILSATAWLVMSDLLWERYPWRGLARDGRNGFWPGVAAIVGSTILGFISCFILLKVMTAFWMEPFEGGQYTDAPYFRYLHAGEISGFVILASFILSVYFNNFPNLANCWLRSLIRTLIAFAGGGLIYWLYYSPVATYALGKVPGIAQPDDTPLVWTLLFLSVIMVHADFFEKWPLDRKVVE
jgi:amino acid transporter, AAT family